MCVSPNIAYCYSSNPYSTNAKWKFKFFDKELFDNLKTSKIVSKIVLVPCGKCFECQTEYKKSWAIRLLKESEYSSSSYFMTLTYDDLHINDSNGYSDFHIFIKNLRNYFYNNFKLKDIKYFACFEYGDKTLRKHWHCILFNAPINDLKYYHVVNGKVCQLNGCKSVQMSSELVSSFWKKGIITIDNVNFNNCSYVAGYVMKKLGDRKDYIKLGLLPPKIFMSKGIGKKFFNDHYLDIYKSDEMFYSKDNKVLRTNPCRYFDRLLEKKDKSLLFFIKNIRDKKYKNVIQEFSKFSDIQLFNYWNNKKFLCDKKKKMVVRNRI